MPRRSEGLLRNDRGFQEPSEFTTWQYVTRTASLVRGHVPLFLVAIGCLVATTLAQLFLPNYQGKILVRSRTSRPPHAAVLLRAA